MTNAVWIFRTCYRNPLVLFRTFLIAIGSLFKRGAEEVSSDEKLGIIHSVWTAGYYHWITESLPRAYLMKSAYPDVVPILPSERYHQFEESLIALGFSDVAYFPNGKNAILKNPIVTECPHQFATTSPELLIKVRDKIMASLNVKPVKSPFRIVYVSRSKARGRKVMNEAEVEAALGRYDAEVINFEDLTFDEQVSLMQESSVLISIHGAALTNMVFMPAGGAIVELLPKKNGVFDYNKVRNSFRHDPCYARLADGLGHKYRWLECATDGKKFGGTHMANIDVDVPKLVGLIESILK